MSSHPIFCPRCGVKNETQTEWCYSCKQPLHDQGQFSNKTHLRPPEQRMSRRTTFTLMGILGGAILLPIGGVAAYLIQQKLNDPHLLTYQFNGAVTAASWSPDGTRVASVGWAALPAKWGVQALKIFNPLTGDTLVTGDTSNDAITSGLAPLEIAWSVDGQQLVTFLGQETTIKNGNRVVEIVQVWDVQTGQRVRSFPVTQPAIYQDYGASLYHVIVHHRALCDRYLATEKINGQGKVYSILEVWNIETGSIIFTQDMQGTEPRFIRDMQWAPDRRRLATLTDEGSYKNRRWEIWDIPTRQRVHSFPLPYFPMQQTMVWSPDGKSIAFGPDIYDVETGRKVMTYHITGQQTLGVMAWLPGEKQVAIRSFLYSGGGWFRRTINPLFVLDTSNSRQLTHYDNIGGSLIWSPHGEFFLAVDELSGLIEVWRTFPNNDRHMM